jgi:hypothetical protein
MLDRIEKQIIARKKQGINKLFPNPEIAINACFSNK